MLKKSILVLLVGVLVWFSRLVHKISVGAAQKPPPTSKSNGAFDEATARAFAEAEAELKKELVGDKLADETSQDD